MLTCFMLVRKWWASRNDAGMSTKLSSRVAKGVGSGEGATGSCADATGPMDASGAAGSVVVVGGVGSGCCGTSSGCEGAKIKLYSA